MAGSSGANAKRQLNNSTREECEGPGPSKTRKTNEYNQLDLFQTISQKCQVFSSSVMCPSTKLSPEVLDKVWSVMTESTGSLSEEDVLSLVTHFVKAMANFARSMWFFDNMSESEQISMCSGATSQLLQYVLARCFCSSCPTTQAQWLLDIQKPKSNMIHKKLKLVNLERFCGSLDFTKDKEAVKAYMTYAKEIDTNYGVSMLHKGLIANLILLNQAHLLIDGVQEELNKATRLLAQTDSCAKITYTGNAFEVTNLILKLNLMDKIFKNNKAPSGQLSQKMPALVAIDTDQKEPGEARLIHIPMGHTVSDELMKTQISNLFKQSLVSIKSPAVMAETYILYSKYRTPPSQNVLPQSMKMFLERTRAVFHNIASELQIERKDQRRLWTMNCSMGVALNCLKMRGSRTGLEQFNYIMGFLDSAEDVTGKTQGVEIKMMDFGTVNRGKLNGIEQQQYLSRDDAVIQHVLEIIRDPISYVMLFMLVMLNSNGLPQNSFTNWKYTVQAKVLALLQKYQILGKLSRTLSETDYSLLISRLKYLGQFLPAMCVLQKN